MKMSNIKTDAKEFLLNANKDIINSYLIQINKKNSDKNQEFDNSIDKETKIDFIVDYTFDDYVKFMNDLLQQSLEFEKELKEEKPQKRKEDFYLSKEINTYYTIIQSLFIKSDFILNYLDEMDVKSEMKCHFLEINKIENIFIDIFKSGTLVNYSKLLELIIFCSGRKIVLDLAEQITTGEERKEYDGRKDTTLFERELIKFKRREKNKDSKKHPKQINRIISFVDNAKISTNINSADIIRLYINPEFSRPYKLIIQEFLQEYYKTLGKSEFLKVFKNLFYILFNDEKDSLLSVENFKKAQNGDTDFRIGDYDGSYSKYFQTKITTLLGLNSY